MKSTSVSSPSSRPVLVALYGMPESFYRGVQALEYVMIIVNSLRHELLCPPTTLHYTAHRWIYDNASLFATKRVMELGSGVGLPGIIAARYSKEVYLTDYIEKLVENLEYNIKINTTYESDDEKSEDPAVQRKVQLKKNIKQTAKAMFFDWHDLDNQPDKCPAVEPVDILLGSELIYTGDPEHAKCLVRVIDKYLNRDPDAFFMHILSDDRDGVPNFIKFMDEGGFSVEIIPVPDKYMGNFNTKQRPETYKFYMFKRKTTSDAIVSSSNNNELITK
eukprot:GEZU01009359.1.p1 GENE.GEZU01009359.1~~GEZU01009359.1.p1  ORF type:complete len:276 (+),score=61.78 GEZU01009359.1:193-1020(+)